MATVITKEGDSIITTVDGVITNVQSIRREDNVISVVPSSSYGEVFNIVREVATGNIIVYYDSSSVIIQPTNLTGDEIVALLGALGAGSRLSHTKLDDVSAGDHHAKYLDSEAVTAAKTVKLDDFTTPDDNTDLDASTTKHGLLRKLDNVVTNFLNGQGGWSAPAGVTDHGALTGLGDDDHTQYILETLADANSVLYAVSDDTPAALAMGASTILARLAAGNIVAATPTQLMALLSGSAGAEFLMNTQKIGGVVDPTTNQQVATKKYVDDNIPVGGYTEGARAYHSADQAITTNTWTSVALDSERYDTDTIHDTVTNNSRLTCKTAGKYIITGNMQFDGNATGVRNTRILLNGTTNIAMGEQHSLPTSGVQLVVATIYDLSVNDYVELGAWHTKGSNLNVEVVGNLSPELAMQRIG